MPLAKKIVIALFLILAIHAYQDGLKGPMTLVLNVMIIVYALNLDFVTIVKEVTKKIKKENVVYA